MIVKRHQILCMVALMLLPSVLYSRSAVRVDDRLPAGNIVFEKIVNDTVYVSQDLRGAEKDWFYWAFRVRGAQGRTLTFVFTRSDVVGRRGPVVSPDKGKTYEYLAEKGAGKRTFTYAFSEDDREVWFYECFPYTPQMWTSFMKSHPKGFYEKGVLCKSRKGRPVPYYRISSGVAKPRVSVMVTSRHHCSEAPATYVAEGLVAAFLEDNESGRWLRDNMELIVVPFIDMDGVVDGDQGKWRPPHDHNRDYTEFLYPETAAFAALVKQVRPDVFLDFHNPTLNTRYVFSPLCEKPAPKEDAFAALVEKYQEGGLNYRTSKDLPFGVSWNTAKNYEMGFSVKQWVLANTEGIQVCRTFEMPFTYAGKTRIYPSNLRQFGHGIARALRALVEENPAP